MNSKAKDREHASSGHVHVHVQLPSRQDACLFRPCVCARSTCTSNVHEPLKCTVGTATTACGRPEIFRCKMRHTSGAHSMTAMDSREQTPAPATRHCVETNTNESALQISTKRYSYTLVSPFASRDRSADGPSPLHGSRPGLVNGEPGDGAGCMRANAPISALT